MSDKKRKEKIKIVMPAKGGVETEIDMSVGNLAYSIGILLKKLAESIGQPEELIMKKILTTNKVMAEEEAKEKE